MDEPFDTISKIKIELRDRIGRLRSDAETAFRDSKALEEQGRNKLCEANGVETALDKLKEIEFPK